MKKPDKNGFTLIELLVVIAVIALLLSVILPALNSAKLTAKKVVCASKMRQWALAEMAYTSENDGQVTPYADTCDYIRGGNARNPDNYWFNRLSSYLTDEHYGYRGKKYDVRKCPVGKERSGIKAVWIGVYYGGFWTDYSPFIYLNDCNDTMFRNRSSPFKLSMVRTPSDYLMMMDTQRDLVATFFRWPWAFDFDGDGSKDSGNPTSPYNGAQAKIHRGGANVALFDGHVEWIHFDDFWEVDSSGEMPIHRYWYNGNRPAPVAVLPNSP